MVHFMDDLLVACATMATRISIHHGCCRPHRCHIFWGFMDPEQNHRVLMKSLQEDTKPSQMLCLCVILTTWDETKRSSHEK